MFDNIPVTFEKKMKSTLSKVFNPKKVIEFSDAFVNNRARIEAVAVIFDDGGSIEEIQRKVMASAQQCRTSYFDAVDSVTDLALNAKDTFSSLDEVIGFYTLMTKEFRLGGAAIEQQKAGMVQLIDSMSVGALTAQDMVMLLDTAPDMVQNIADYMNAPVERLQNLAAEGLITADVVKNSMFDAAAEINNKYSAMPMTWSDAWTVMGNTAMAVLGPLLLLINGLVNGIDMLAPLVLGLGSAFAVFKVAAKWEKISKMAALAYNNAVLILSTSLKVLKGQKNATAAAAEKWNSVLLKSPITWYVMIAMVLVGVFYAIISAINHITGSTLSATGIICGAFHVIWAAVQNVFYGILNLLIGISVSIYNVIADVVNFVWNLFHNVGDSFTLFFLSIEDTILSVVQGIVSFIDSIFGTHLSDGIEKMRNDMSKLKNELYGDPVEVIPKISFNDVKFDHVDYSDAWNKGDKFGKGIEESMGRNFSGQNMDFVAMMNGGSYGKAFGSSLDGNSLALDPDTIAGIGETVGKAKGDQQITVNVDIEQNNNNQIDSRVDAVDIMSYWTREFGEKLAVAMEGVLA